VESSLDDLAARLERERQAADRAYNDALTALDRALGPAATLPAAQAPAERTRLEELNRRWDILPAGPPSAAGSITRRLANFIWRLIGPALQAQTELNSILVDHLNRAAAAEDNRAAAASRLRDTLHAELQATARFQSLLLQYLQTMTAYIDTRDRSLGAGEFRERLAMNEQRLAAMKRETDQAREGGSAAVSPASSAASGAAAFARPVDSVTYVGFEDRYRGTPADIRRRVEEYLPLLERAESVVDIGCGRGELLAALRDRGVASRGVDSNPAMVEVCRAQGLEVEQGDAVSYLARHADGSIGAISAIQVVEHFEPAYLLRFLETSYLKMSPGAPLVLETINAACWMAFFETYIRDLTHQRPLHPDTLSFLVEANGFSSVDVRYRQPVTAGDRLAPVTPEALASPDAGVAALAATLNDHAVKLNARLFSSMDYAVIARR
jgi:2-polyprenyl-3-methyl-5-hydroxy-6-metoxy-1,4-benzoquinol methylase